MKLNEQFAFRQFIKIFTCVKTGSSYFANATKIGEIAIGKT